MYRSFFALASDPIRFMVGDCRVWKIGPLELFILRSRREWRVGHLYDLRPEVAGRLVTGEKVEHVPELAWCRWPASEDSHALRLVPVMPDRAVVVRPDAPLTLNAGRSVDFFVGIPVWLALHEISSTPQFLIEVPTRLLSDTWFGEPDDGELCYASVTSARRFIDEMDPRPNRVITRLEVRNDNEESLQIERICLRTQWLPVFANHSRLWTPNGRIIYRGVNQASQIIFGRRPAESDESMLRIGGRDGESRRGFFAMSIGGNTRSFGW